MVFYNRTVQILDLPKNVDFLAPKKHFFAQKNELDDLKKAKKREKKILISKFVQYDCNRTVLVVTIFSNNQEARLKFLWPY